MPQLSRFSLSTSQSVVITTFTLVVLTTISCLEADISHDPKYHPLRQLYPIDANSHNFYQMYYDLEPWKRAPSAGWYGMRGKKVPTSNFFGMRGKKGPSGFLGMRGKKMDPFLKEDASNEVYPPVDPLDDDAWTPSKPGARGDEDNIQTERSALLNMKANLEKINI